MFGQESSFGICFRNIFLLYRYMESAQPLKAEAMKICLPLNPFYDTYLYWGYQQLFGSAEMGERSNFLGVGWLRRDAYISKKFFQQLDRGWVSSLKSHFFDLDENTITQLKNAKAKRSDVWGVGDFKLVELTSTTNAGRYTNCFCWKRSKEEMIQPQNKAF